MQQTEAQTDSRAAPESTLEVRGHITDPKLVGYQILTNYESTYWRVLVGNEAWSLYEVLRSFCHEQNNSCHPSINLLMGILGLKQRRVLTGWTTTVKEKEYRYPGLIDVLQEHQLVIAEISGQGPKLHYTFHVNLTPGLLSAAQLARLSPALQKRHSDLLRRCQEELTELYAKRRPPKVVDKEATPAPEGYDKLSEGYDKLSEGYDKLSDKQQPYNNTHRTTTGGGYKSNNNIGASRVEPDVVVALTHLGISKQVALRLAKQYDRAYIMAKIDFLSYLQETDSSKVKNPRGWLRKAIEEDYGPPDGYLSPEEREAALAEQRREAEEAAQVMAEWEEEQQQQQNLLREQNEKRLAALQARYGTSAKELSLWPQLLERMSATTTRSTFSTWIAPTQLLSLKDGRAIIGVPNEQAKSWLEIRLHIIIQRALTAHLGEPCELEFIVLRDTNAEESDPAAEDV